MGGAPLLAIQAVNYRTRAYLERCLRTAAADAQGSGLEYEVNVLNNDPQESLSDLAGVPGRCRILEAPRNLGFGAGHNLLARATQAPYLLILNPDVEFLFPRTTERLLTVITGGKRVKAVGPKLLGFDGKAQVYDHARLEGLRAQIALRGGNSYWRETDIRLEVAWVSGAAMLVDREAFMAVGGFDESFFLYKEDEDLCLRLRQGGARVVYEPAAKLLHHGSVVAHRRQDLATATSQYVDKHFRNRRLAKAFDIAHRGLGYLRL